MNFYNPYIPYSMAAPTVSRGLLRGALGGINWGSFLNNTQRTLGIINQAIPMVKQVTPLVNNAKTMFRVMNEFKKVDNASKTKEVKKTETINEIKEEPIDNSTGPVFFA